jgi:hypothetical protein
MDSKFFDSIYEGDSANGAKLGMGLTGGDFWPRIGGCSILYRGGSIDSMDFSQILAVAEPQAEQISPPAYVTHSSRTEYFYLVRRANHCGDEEQTLSAAVKLVIDADGELAEPLPNCVFEVKTGQIAGGKVELLWYYNPLEQGSAPVRFNVYYNNGTGQVNYDSVLATINYAGRRFYSWQTAALSPGRYLFAVRAEDSAGLENDCRSVIDFEVDAASPEGVSILSAQVL